jgi:predicted DNA-binding transcriptional regulator YafY
MNKAQKLVKMVELMQRRGGVRARELLLRFDIDPRTLRRYLSDLRELGLPIEDVDNGPDRTISLDPTYRRAGVQLTLPEVLSLHFGRKLFTFLDGTQFAADLDDAIERLEPAISRAHADLARQLDRQFMAVSEHAKDYKDQGDLIDDVVTALIYDNPARAEYTKPSGATGQYELEPLTLATYRQGLYLFARDRKDGKVKTFAVERFTRFSRLRLEHFTPPRAFNPEKHISSAFGIISGDPVEVSAVFDREVAWLVRERRWHSSQKLEGLADGRVRARYKVAMSNELVTWLLGFGGSVVVEKPQSLRDQLKASHQKALEKLN